VPDDDIIEYYQIDYSYEIRGCMGSTGRNTFTLNRYIQSYKLQNLEENSDVLISFAAVNQAGSGVPASIRTYTLPAGETYLSFIEIKTYSISPLSFLAPTKPPANIRSVAVTSTSISIAWDPVPCSYRNTNITGYSVSYNVEANNFNITINLGTTDEKYMKATGLIPGTSYMFIITPMQNFNRSSQLFK